MTTRPARPVFSAAWPLLLLAAPAFVAIWSGWVGLGELTGFGVIHPLPGIADTITLNTAITLPIGVETYAAYALKVWLTGDHPARARVFARWSALGSLAFGAAGQVAYHLMVAAGVESAPWQITAAVACLPVAVLGMGAALAHLSVTPDAPAEPTPPAPAAVLPTEGVTEEEQPRVEEHAPPPAPKPRKPRKAPGGVDREAAALAAAKAIRDRTSRQYVGQDALRAELKAMGVPAGNAATLSGLVAMVNAQPAHAGSTVGEDQ